MNIQDYNRVTDRLQVSEKCRDEVFNMNRESNIKHKKIKRSTVIIIAAAVLACTGTATAFASGFGVFDKVANNRNRTLVNEHGVECKIDKYDNDDYSQVAEHADKLEDNLYSNTQLAVSVDSVYCDGRNLFVALKGHMLDENTSNTGYIKLTPQIKIGDKTYNNNTQEADGCIRCEGSLTRDQGEANSFSGVLKFEFDDDNLITGKTDADITLSGIEGAEGYYAGEQTFKSADPIIFTVGVEPDESLRESVEESVSENGYEAKVYEITPAGIIIGTKNPPEYEYNKESIDINDAGGSVLKGPKYSIVALFYDENGNELDGLPQTEPIDYNDGFRVCMLQATDSKKIIVRWYNKQEHDDSNELGIKLYHEETIDLIESN